MASDDKEAWEQHMRAMPQREAEFHLKVRDTLNALAVSYPDLFNPGVVLGFAAEIAHRGGASREDFLLVVNKLWDLLEKVENTDQWEVLMEAKARDV